MFKKIALCLVILLTGGFVYAQSVTLPPADAIPKRVKTYSIALDNIPADTAVVSTLVAAIPSAVKNFAAPVDVEVSIKIDLEEILTLIPDASDGLELPPAQRKKPRRRGYRQKIDTVTAGTVIVTAINQALPQAVKDYTAEVNMRVRLRITIKEK